MVAQSDPVRPAVLIPKRFEPLMVLSRRTRNSKQAVFPNAFDLLCFAAAVGFGRDTKGMISANSNDKATGGEVVMNVPSRKDCLLCDMVAVAATGGDEILETGRLQERLDIYMAYACGGMDYLLELTVERPSARAAVEAVIRKTDVDDSVAELKSLVSSDGDG